MKGEAYRPIACGLHELYQLAVIRRAPLQLRWQTGAGETRSARLLALDVYTRDGAEYLSGETAGGERCVIRLDLIRQAHWADGGGALDPTVG